MEAGEASLGGLELLSERWNAMLNCCRVQVKLAVELVSSAGVCECTCVHYADARKRLCTHWVGRTWVWSQN